MMRRRTEHSRIRHCHYASSTLSCSWVPLTLIFLLYTSGLTIGESTEASKSENSDDSENNATSKKNYTLTGNPQIDYVHDPNLPRELNGYNLSTYPFYNKVPSSINFSCDGRKDGYYASIEHKCQLYHQCLSDTRYDFLCANYTAFDQKTFNCQFVSEVDCPNSELFFGRNKDLYVAKSTTPPPRRVIRPGLYARQKPKFVVKPPSLVDPDAPPAPKSKVAKQGVGSSQGQELGSGAAALPEDELDPDIDRDQYYYPVDDYPRAAVRFRKRCRRRCRGALSPRRCINRCRRGRPRRPAADYYYPDYYYSDYDDYYYDYDDYYVKRKPRGKNPRLGQNRVASSTRFEHLSSTESSKVQSKATTTTEKITTQATTTPPSTPDPDNESLEFDASILAKQREEIFAKRRHPPKIRPPVPIGARTKYASFQGRTTTTTTTTTATTKPPSTSQSSTQPNYDYYEDDYMDYVDYMDQKEIEKSTAKQPPPSTTKPTTTSTTTTLAPKTPSYRQKFRHFQRSRTYPTTPTSTTPTTTPSTTSSTTSRATRVNNRISLPPKTTMASTTLSTTTEEPEYEYEYEYIEESIPYSSSTLKATSPPSISTPTTSPRPSRTNIFRGRRPYLSGPIQTSTSVSVQEAEAVDEEEFDDSRNTINRRHSAFIRDHSSPSLKSSSSPTENSVTLSSTSERYSSRGGSNVKQTYQQEPIITVKVSQDAQNSRRKYAPKTEKPTESPVIRTRPSRFWQRPAKVVASSAQPPRFQTTATTTATTTTPAPLLDYDYAEESGSIGLQNSRFKASIPSSISSYNRETSPPRSRHPHISSTSSVSSSSSGPRDLSNYHHQQQQYLRPTQNNYRDREPLHSSTGRPADDNNNYVSPYGPSPSQMGLIGSFPSSSSRPEFISLLRDDEEMYYEPAHMQSQSPRPPSGHRRVPHQPPPPPLSRSQYYTRGQPGFHHSQKNLYGAAQETFHTFLPPPTRFRSSGFMRMGDFVSSPMRMFSYGNPDPASMLGGKK